MGDHLILAGRLARLEPLRPDHAEPLFASASDPEVWRWKLVGRPTTVKELRTLITDVMIGPDPAIRQPFLVSRLADGEAIGSTTLANLDRLHRRVEMGFTWLARSSWGQGYNEDKKYVLLKHCFETMGMERVEWQCDHLNTRSQRALERLGFVYEGTLRSRHQRPDGTRRDSMYYSLIASEWPAAAVRLSELVADRAAPS